MSTQQEGFGLGAGSTVEFELIGHAGEMGKYRFYVRGANVTSGFAELLNVPLLPDGSIALEPYLEGPGQRFVQRIARRLLGYENALYARQKAGLPAMTQRALIQARIEAAQSPAIGGWGFL